MPVAHCGQQCDYNALLTFYTITYRNNHVKVEILYRLLLSKPFHTTIILGSRKFCDYRFSLQFLTQGIIYMFCYGLVITTIQLCHLLAIQPRSLILQLDIELDAACCEIYISIALAIPCISLWCLHLSPGAAVEVAVAHGLADVVLEYVLGALEVGYGACHAEYAVVGAC